MKYLFEVKIKEGQTLKSFVDSQTGSQYAEIRKIGELDETPDEGIEEILPEKQTSLSIETTAKKDTGTGYMKWLPLLVMSLALAIIILDTTILNVTLRTITLDLHTTLHNIQWVITAYSLMLAAFTITGGRMGDLFGRKKMFVTGAIIFAVGSFITSISQNVGVMIWGEAIIEGLGACLMMPATLSLIRSTYQGRDMQIAFGIWGGVASAAAALGPLVGGWFTTHYSWRWAFRINIVVALILVICSYFIKEYRERVERTEIDFVGIVLSALGLLAIVFGFIQAYTYGWIFEKAPLQIFGKILSFGGPSATLFFIVIGLILLAVFMIWEVNLENTGRTPLVSLKIFRNTTFITGTLITAIISLGLAGLTFSIPVYFQSILRLDPFHTGLAMLPMTAVILISAPASAWLSKFIAPKRIIQAGLILAFMSFLVLRLTLHVGTGEWTLTPGFILFGLGMGLIMAQSSTLTLSAVSVEQSGEAAGVMNTLRSLGMTLGAAILGTVLLTTLSGHFETKVNQSSIIPPTAKSEIIDAASRQSTNLEFGGGVQLGQDIPPQVTSEISAITTESIVRGGQAVLDFGLVFMILALLVSMKLPEESNIAVEY